MKRDNYRGYELGPIRPPSEAESLLLRVTRNCPWNKCKFCTLYKGTTFSIRPLEAIIGDLEVLKICTDALKAFRVINRSQARQLQERLVKEHGEEMRRVFPMAWGWYRAGMESVFLQDANSLVIKPEAMISILSTIREGFPEVNRITSYARSHTIAKLEPETLARYKQAGLTRIHVGMESASDTILNMVNKGVTKKVHVEAGLKVKEAGIELSEYFMPGLGGNEYSSDNALETAEAINSINPDFLRIRTLAVTENAELMDDYRQGKFTRANDQVMAKEIYLLLSHLKNITTTVKSDHILNLLPEVEGRLPEDRERMLFTLSSFLSLDEDQQNLYRVGRRTGLMYYLDDLKDDTLRQKALTYMKSEAITAENIDGKIDALMNKHI